MRSELGEPAGTCSPSLPAASPGPQPRGCQPRASQAESVRMYIDLILSAVLWLWLCCGSVLAEAAGELGEKKKIIKLALFWVKITPN